MSALEIRPYGPEMAPGLLELFKGFGRPRPSDEQWRRLLGYRPPRGEAPDTIGQVLLDGARPVGFIGTLHSAREVRGKAVVLCNLSSWIVREEHRASGLSILLKAVEDRRLHYTNLTASPQVAQILLRLGFKPLDPTAYMFTLARAAAGPAGEVSFETSPEALSAALRGRELEYFQDHRLPACRHVRLVDAGGDACYGVYTLRRYRKVLPFAHFHYLSDPALFERRTGPVARFLMKEHGVPAFMVESRFLSAAPSWKQGAFAVRVPRFYRSSLLAPREVDHLYTEFPVLGI